MVERSTCTETNFTGSTEVGKLLMRGASDTVKKVSLELGGHAPFIVFPDADLDTAVEGVIQSKFRNNGQTCVCANRIYVHTDIVDAFVEKFKREVEKLTVGYGLEEDTQIGPLIDEQAYLKVQHHIQDAVDRGATLVCGGNRLTEYENGYFIEPAIIRNVTDEMKVMKEETFGPVAPISTFQSVEEVIARANHTPYGLAAYIFTTNLKTAVTVSEQLEYGIVGVNDGLPSVAQAPFGGFKESGLGREGGHYGIEEF